MNTPVTIVVAAALVAVDGRVLVQLRPAGRPLAGLWEFPGGKLEPGETLAAALARELREELGITIGASEPLAFTTFATEARELVLLLFVVREWAGIPRAEHADALSWVSPAELTMLAMPPADRPLVTALQRYLLG